MKTKLIEKTTWFKQKKAKSEDTGNNRREQLARGVRDLGRAFQL